MVNDNNYFLAIDFDGTVSKFDVIDSILNQFAKEEWFIVEGLWQNGIIGSRECLARQLSLVEASMETLLNFVDKVPIDEYFYSFVQYIHKNDIPCAVISDGFIQLIKRILAKNDISNLKIYASKLFKKNGQFQVSFTNMTKDCSAGTCKCMVAKKLAKGLPIILIGDGRSDFCLADKADYVLAKGGLATYCEKHRIPFTAINNFNDAIKCLQTCDIHYYTSLCKDHSQDE